MIFKTKPWKHQLEAIKRAGSLEHFGFFFEVGTGKSGACINTLRVKYKKQSRMLRTIIFCPPVVINNWKKEFAMHSYINENEIILLQGTGVQRCSLFEKHAYSQGCYSLLEGTPQSKIFVTNYESLLMPKLFDNICRWEPEIVVCDEYHKLKNPSTKRSKKMAELVDGERGVRNVVPYRYILTGTPILNSPMDIFGQFRILDGGHTFGKNFFTFRAEYFYDANAHFKQKYTYFPDWRIKPLSLVRMNNLISTVSMSVKKDQCLDLPPLVRKTIEVPMSPEQQKFYLEMKQDLVTYLGDKACLATLAITKALRLLQISSGYVQFEDGSKKSLKTPKMDALYDLLETLTPDHKVIVWSVFKENYEQIRKVCEDLKIKYVEVNGEISASAKQKNIDTFNNDPECRLFSGNPSSGGIGINLTISSYSIFYSRNFSLENDLQSEARNYRGGSEIHPRITRIDLVAEKTIDALVLESLSKKMTIGQSLLKTWREQL